jgi:serine/threonine protein kinase
MEPAIARARALATVTFEDGLGERHQALGVGNEPLEVLTLNEELTAESSFEFALRERVGRLAAFQHESYGRVRGVARVLKGKATLAIVSDHVQGVRLSEILSVAEKQQLSLELQAALFLIRQVVSAVAALHEKAPDACHGAIGPERVIITPQGRPVVVEHVLGSALEQLQFSHERYWKELRIPLPETADLPHFDQRSDVTQLGALALAILLGRPLRLDEYPARLEHAMAEAKGGMLPADVRSWLVRALQLSPRTAFASAIGAKVELDMLPGGTDGQASREALESFLARYHSCVGSDQPADHSSAPAAAGSQPSPPQPQPWPSPASLSTSAVTLKPEPPSAPKFEAHAEAHQATTPRTEPFATPFSERPMPTEERAYVPFHKGEAEASADMPKRSSFTRRQLVAAAVVLTALASGGTLATRHFFFSPAPVVDAMGTLVVNTNPAGVSVAIDGEPRGTTPLNLSLTPGEHVLQLGSGSDARTIPVTLTAGAQVSQFIELPNVAPARTQLLVRTEPSGARVSVDGTPRGTSPLTVEDLTPGVHRVTLENDLGSVTQEVTIEAGTTASLVVPMTVQRGVPVSGWISISAPVDVQVFEDQRLIGTSRSDRIMVSAGRHELELVNEALGYRSTRTVQVGAGQVAAVRPEWPNGSLALNAVPWADVWVDGQRIGETPIGNVSVPIGSHEVVFRHPELGEQRATVTVTLVQPARLSVDMRER